MVDVWGEIDGKKHIKPIMATIYRLVESQEQVATLGLVNTVYEQGILEELIESTKNRLPNDMNSFHYLLKTPFRYPPLKYGSRFGKTFERSLFYGSLTIATALAETAYYRFVYMRGPETPFSSMISSEYSSFSVQVKSDLAIFLDEEPFSTYESILTSPVSYEVTQQLGTMMRQNGVDVFRYVSARDKNNGKNMALFDPKAFNCRKPSHVTSWLCQTNVDEVGFLSKEDDQRVMYRQSDFWVENAFPSPAT